jgi:ABC-type multidrug transport system ATPase subunit
MNGSIDGGEILLVIGKPGSGCTTFLKTMANMREEYAEVGGKCLYNGLNPAEAKALYQGEFAFSGKLYPIIVRGSKIVLKSKLGEDDIHFHSLSVKTTLRFALNARLSSSTPGRSHILEEQLKILLQLFDMEHVSNVAVGNDYIRGISGGQRHRVTLAEALCAKPRYSKLNDFNPRNSLTWRSILSLDNPTRGLDSTTALRVMQLLREYTTQSQSCTAVSLYQSSDAIASYCDKALVLNEGRVCYLGPTSDSRQYFEDLGFECPPQASLTDFLTSMSGSPGSRRLKPGLCGRPVPVTSEDFEQRFRESKYFVPVGMIEVPNVTSARQHSPSVFKLPLYWQTYECMIRHYQIHLTDRSAWIAEAFGTIAQALVLGTLFWNQEAVTQGLYTRSSALFFCALIMVLQATAEFGNTFAQRPILLKQRALCFYRPAAYALGQILADIPWKAIFVLYSVPIYWLVNFKRDAGSFFTWYLSLYVSLMAMGVMFRTIAVFTTTATRAVLPVGILMNSFIIFTGFYINPPGMKIWLGWLRYLNVSALEAMRSFLESQLIDDSQCTTHSNLSWSTRLRRAAFSAAAWI